MTTLFTRDDNLCQIVSSILLSLTRRRVVVVIIISIRVGDPVWWLGISNNDDGHPHNNICVSIVCMHVTRKHFLNDFFCFFHNSGTFSTFPALLLLPLLLDIVCCKSLFLTRFSQPFCFLHVHIVCMLSAWSENEISFSSWHFHCQKYWHLRFVTSPLSARIWVMVLCALCRRKSAAFQTWKH